MKDLPHHMKKLNRRIIRSEHREELEDENHLSSLPNPPQPKSRPRAQIRKLTKAKMKKTTKARTPTPLTPQERNKRMKKRVPIFDRTSKVKVAKQGARATKKKTPRI
jgi:hypothetical protein